MLHKPSNRRDIRVAIICALPLEYDAVRDSFDEIWNDFDSSGVPGDPNHYVVGSFGETPVVLTLLPGMGKAAAASASASLLSSYINLQCVFLVGICGAVPEVDGSEIILGDVIIAKSIMPFDFGRQYPDTFRPKQAVQDVSVMLPKEIRVLNAFIETRAGREELADKAAQTMCRLQDSDDRGKRYTYPGQEQDNLFAPSYRHKHQKPGVCNTCDACLGFTDPVCPQALGLSCADLGCSTEKIVTRSRFCAATVPSVGIHVGTIASADTVMKSGHHRDEIASAYRVIGFEMEGAGVSGQIPCMIIKGVSDYADSHKSKGWQQYASATAASTAKTIIMNYFHAQESNTSETSQIVHFIPFAKNDSFVGREVEIKELNRMLFEKDNKRVAIFGLGGVGKTQVALHIAHRTAETMPNYSVFWIPVFSASSFEQACNNLVKKLNIPMKKEDDSRQILKGYLESQDSGTWLLILDNADDESIIYNASSPKDGMNIHLPQAVKNGRILITTRSKRVAVRMAKNCFIHLQGMSYEEAEMFLDRELVLTDEMCAEEDKTQLIETLCYLPLAISQAVSYLNMNEIPISHYLQLWKTSEQDAKELMSQGFDDDTHYDPSQSAVMTTWLISFKQIRERSPAAAQILSFITWIEPKAIPRSLLPSVGSEQQMTAALGLLKGYAFLSSRSSHAIFDMHSLVHYVMKLEDFDKSGLKEALLHMEDVFPTHDWENRAEWQQYLPHALQIYWGSADCESADSEVATRQSLGLGVGRCLAEDARYSEAVSIMEDVTARYQKTLKEDDPDRIKSEIQLARVYNSLSEYPKATDLLEHVVAIEKATLDENDPDRILAISELSDTYLSAGVHIERAITLLEDIVALAKKNLAEDDGNRLTPASTLADAYVMVGRFNEGIEILEHIDSIENDALADLDPQRQITKRLLAQAYLASGQTEKGIELLERVVASLSDIFQDAHPEKITAQVVLAVNYSKIGRGKEAVDLLESVIAPYQEPLTSVPHLLSPLHFLSQAYLDHGFKRERAFTLLEEVVAFEKKSLAGDDPRRILSLRTLATRYLEFGIQFERAFILLEEVVAIERKTLAEGDSDRLQSLRSLARAYLDHDTHIEQALGLLEEIVSAEKKFLAEDDPGRLLSMHSLATRYLEYGIQVERAFSLLEEVVAIERNTLAEDNLNRCISQHKLADAYLENDVQIKQAINLLEEVVAIESKILPKDDPRLLTSQHDLAKAYLDNDMQLERAVGLLEEVVAIRTSNLSEDDDQRLISQYQLARAYSKSKSRLGDAIALLTHVVAVERISLAEDDTELITTQNKLAKVYLKDNKVDKAIPILEHVAEIRKRTLSEDDSDLLKTQRNLAKAYVENSEAEKAIPILEHVVAVESTTLAIDDADRLLTQRKLAEAYIEDDQADKAIPILEHVVAAEKNALEEEDSDRLLSQYRLARAYLDNGQAAKAIGILEYVVIMESTLPEEDSDRLMTQYRLAQAYMQNNQVRAAIDLLEHVVAVEGNTLEEDDPERAASLELLEEAYLRNASGEHAADPAEYIVIKKPSPAGDGSSRAASQKESSGVPSTKVQVDDVINLLEEMVIENSSLPEDHPDRLESQDELAKGYLNNGQMEDAISLLEHIVSIKKNTLAENDPSRIASQQLLETAYEFRGFM
ncbi:unnamed protein product [Clonostachys rosea]|uniref:Nucleoside phosphorylase domain-containing protein n=1 Tax=Bionectria ochroleuca TaxID=29856 RepID=A0ABY6U8I4_BIOOC|nr:unnamed protein product [Clonostachys rosea]